MLTFQPTEVTIDFYQPVHQLRSSSQGLQHRHRSGTVLALCSFKHSSVALWNSLPADKNRNCSSLSSFRSTIKTQIYSVPHSLATAPTNSSATSFTYLLT